MSAEKFDPATQEWRAIASMNTRRSSVGVGVLNGLLYAVNMQIKKTVDKS
jgi:kelch-like protein 2/3